MFLVLQSISVTCTMLIMWEALELGFNGVINTNWCGFLVFTPCVLYIIVCFRYRKVLLSFLFFTSKFVSFYFFNYSNNRKSQKAQLTGAYILTIAYSIIMILLTVALFVAGGECPFNLTAIFLIFMACIHLLAGLIHFDLVTLMCGLVYWVGIPSCFIFLQVYMVTNINDVSWGTRSSGGGGKPKVNLTFKEFGLCFYGRKYKLKLLNPHTLI